MMFWMKRHPLKQRKSLLYFVLIVFLLSSLPNPTFYALPVRAETNEPDQVDAPSADASQEIVYIDANGVIRVLDWQTTGGPLVDWASDLDKNTDGSVHGTGFRSFTLGDVNNDGDNEIIGIRGGSTDGELVVYDPVVAPGQSLSVGQKTPNGIPWAKLYDVTLKGKPVLVNAGNYDVNVPGDEIAYLFELNTADKKDPTDVQRMVILKATTATPTGRDWQEHAEKTFSNNWQTLASGNFDGTGADELVMVDEDTTGGELNVYRVDSGIGRIGRAKGSDSAPWKNATFLQWDGSGKKELVAVREGNGLPSFYVWQWNGDNQEFKELHNEVFDPGPRFVFGADINGDKKQEAFMIRNIPSKQGLARLIPRGDEQSKIPSELEQELDSDNGYGAGAGGDIDGDGREEVILIRNNKMLVFERPESTKASATRTVTTNRRSIEIGDLDKNGFASGPQFCATKSKIDGQLPVGIVGPSVFDLQLTNCGSTDATPFSITGLPSWFQVTAATGQTPSTIGYNFNAQSLAPGVYTTTISIDSSAAVVNKPFKITISLTVTGAQVTPNPASVLFNVFGECISTTTTIMTQTVNMVGSPGVKYTAAVVNSPDMAAAQAALSGPIDRGYINEQGQLVVRDAAGHDATVASVGPMEVSASGLQSVWPSGTEWLTATSKSDIIPDTLTLNANPQVHPEVDRKQALVVIVADARAGVPPDNIRIIPVTLLCTRSQLRLPYVAR